MQNRKTVMRPLTVRGQHKLDYSLAHAAWGCMGADGFALGRMAWHGSTQLGMGAHSLAWGAHSLAWGAHRGIWLLQCMHPGAWLQLMGNVSCYGWYLS